MLLLTVSAWTWLGELQMEVKPSSMEEKTPLYLPSEGGEKIPLYLITPSSRPYFLLKLIFHVLPLRRCFDVHWIIVHTVQDQRLFKAPLFRDVFHWITELSAFNENSVYGIHERNVGADHVAKHATHGFVYFLDDDNLLSMDLCHHDVHKNLDVDMMYYADQYTCAKLRLGTSEYPSRWRCGIKSTQVNCSDFSLVGVTDTGSWLTPVWLLQQEAHITWDVHQPIADGLYFTAMVKALLAHDGNDGRIQHLSMVKFLYNDLHCNQIKLWSYDQLLDSILTYRDLTSDMKLVRESVPIQEKMMDRSEVTFHEFPHILHVLRSCISVSTAMYVEIGVWKGATSILMSRHPLLTNVIGIDGFFYDRQRNEAEVYRKALQGNGTIHWMKKSSTEALPDLLLQLNGTEIDILFIDGNHRMRGVQADFALYAPLVVTGGFIVFDDFTETSFSSGVREAIMHMILNGDINLERYEIIPVQNVMGAGATYIDDNFFYDWQAVMSNEFVLRKLI